MKRYNVIGLMSGTSLDGLDLAYVEFKLNQEKWLFDIKSSQTVKFPSILLDNIKSHIKTDSKKVNHHLDYDLAEFFSNKVNEFIKSRSPVVDLIASHGQTVCHSPSEGISIQLGSGKRMSELIDLPVVSDFRIQDVRLGGQGAPLVPIGDQLLFPTYKYCLNLGGIANISVKNSNAIIASDISICNTALNYFSRKEGFDYDENGALAASGQKKEVLYNRLNELDYYKDPWPKSLDSSFFYQQMLPIIEGFKNVSHKDVMSTLVYHIAYQVSQIVGRSSEEVLVTGGGRHNDFLIKLMRHEFSMKIAEVDNELIDYKEALIFAFLGVLRYRNEINVLSSVTGASTDHCAGRIHLGGSEQ